MMRRIKDLKKGAVFRLREDSVITWKKVVYNRSWKKWRCIDTNDGSHCVLLKTNTWVWEC